MRAWTPSNSEQMVPREHIHGTIRGVDFGPRVFVVARAEAPMLLWLSGHSWSLNGSQRYAASHLTLIKNRQRMDGWRNYTTLDPEGGRLTIARAELAKNEICKVFDGDRWPAILHAIETKQTLLIEGGGQQPQPSLNLGRDAYLEWRQRQSALAITNGSTHTR